MIPALLLATLLATPPTGAKLFDARGCARCHSVGGGLVIGPDLAGVGQHFTRQQLVAWILSPGRRNARFPRMPQLGVTPRDAGAIADFLLQQGETARIASWQSSSNRSGSRP